jgi:phage anti-repressor protein
MNELVKITEQDGQQLVSARELHEFLESERQFGNWIQQRIDKYGFIENQDYICFNKFVKAEKYGNKTLKEYAITIDMAKELAMVEGNEKGKQARRYFIEIEKKYKQNILSTPINQSYLDLVEMILKTLRDQEIAMKKLDARINQIEFVQNTARKQLEYFPKPIVKPRNKTGRQILVQFVNSIVRRDNLFPRSVWIKLYEEFCCRYRKNIRRRANNLGISQLDWIEQFDYIDELYAIAVELFQNKWDIKVHRKNH